MRSHLLVVVAAAVGCGDPQLGPFQALPVDVRFEIDGLDGVVHVARDRFGIAHVHASSYPDLGYAQGYVMAHDRLAQMEMLRRFATGTLAELYGEDAVPLDVSMRIHRMRAFAEETWNELQRSTADTDLVAVLQRFADGVNAYVADVNAGKWPVDPIAGEAGVAALYAPARFAAWTPIDSIAIMRLFTFAQSWTVREELDLTELDIRMRRVAPAVANDLLAFAPVATQLPTLPPPPGTPNRPVVADAVFDDLFRRARSLLAPALPPTSALVAPQVLLRPFLGSTAFVVGTDYTGEQFEARGKSILTADMQGMLANPSAFYPMHAIVAPGTGVHDHDVVGLMLPGVPVAIAGTNGRVGWAPTLGTHDVNDLYLEKLTADGTRSIHDLGATEEPIATITEEIRIGEYGDITTTQPHSFDVVPRHGPVLARSGTAALAVRYTGYAASHELAALWYVSRSTVETIGLAELALQLQHGPHYMVVDHTGTALWTTVAEVPSRPAGARAWTPAFPGGAAPFFVLDGTNPEHEWVPGSRESVPVQTATAGAIVVADADFTGATTDGDPLNVGYLGFAYANGLRHARIAQLLDQQPRPLDERDLARIHHDTQSTLGAAIKAEVVRILREAPELGALTPAQLLDVELARDVLDGWNLETPIGNVSADAASAATLLFNTWMVHFIERTIGDELAAAQHPVKLDDDRAARIVYRLLVDRQALATAAGEPRLCNGTCARHVIDAALDAIAALGRDSASWRWGAAHELRMPALFPDPDNKLRLPRSEESPPQLPGDMFAVGRADGGWQDTDFTSRLGVAYRMQLVGDALGAPFVMRLEMPTGTVLDTRDPHYRDLLDKSYLTRTPVVVPYAIDDIIAAGESRWEMR